MLAPLLPLRPTHESSISPLIVHFSKRELRLLQKHGHLSPQNNPIALLQLTLFNPLSEPETGMPPPFSPLRFKPL
jgi:hypothetical protein